MSETGHARNIQYFSEIISYVTGYGAVYDPSNKLIELADLNTALTAAEATMTTVTEKLADYKTAVNDREDGYANLKKLSTRIVNAIEASGATDNEIKDAKSVNRKIQGTRTKKLPADDPGTPDNENEGNSVSQQSYTQLLAHLRDMIELADSFPSYAPNEIELQIASLTDYADSLATANQAVINSVTDISNARIARNAVMYKDPGSLYVLASLVKKYVKSLFGATSPQYKQISKIPFRSYNEG